ncbi:MAG TPA: universal stress protein [Xanthobacteraceae bacterium]|nr:universal stress protein [Xanthobacteraceae bacterium]
MFGTIVVANDGSEGGFKALELACELAKRHRAALHMISVEEMPTFPTSIDEILEIQQLEDHKFHDVLMRARKVARAKQVKLRTDVIAGHAVAAIVNYVRARKADLLIVGFMGHSALYERIIGSTSDRLVRLAPCPVLVAK